MTAKTITLNQARNAIIHARTLHSMGYTILARNMLEDALIFIRLAEMN